MRPLAPRLRLARYRSAWEPVTTRLCDHAHCRIRLAVGRTGTDWGGSGYTALARAKSCLDQRPAWEPCTATFRRWFGSQFVVRQSVDNPGCERGTFLPTEQVPRARPGRAEVAGVALGVSPRLPNQLLPTCSHAYNNFSGNWRIASGQDSRLVFCVIGRVRRSANILGGE